MLPTYYVFYLSGQVMLGRTRRLPEYGEFVGLWHANVGEDGFGSGESGFLVDLWSYLWALFEGWGEPMLIGSIPWAIAGSWLAYVLSLRFVRRHRQFRHQRRLARLRGERPPSKIVEFIHEHDPFHRHDHGPGEAKSRRAPRGGARAPERGKSG